MGFILIVPGDANHQNDPEQAEKPVYGIEFHATPEGGNLQPASLEIWASR